MGQLFEDADAVEVYNVGLCYLSVCVPKDMPIERVEAAANVCEPTGVTPWKKSDDAFKGGEVNPCPCNDKPNTHRHYLLSC